MTGTGTLTTFGLIEVTNRLNRVFDKKYQGFSRVMTRPAGRVKEVSKSRGSGRVGSLRFKISRVGSGRVGSRSFLNLAGRVGSGRVASRGFKISRVGSGRVKRFQNLVGRVGSGQEVFQISRVGSGHDPRDTGHFAGQAKMTRELFWANPRVKPADLARGSAFF